MMKRTVTLILLSLVCGIEAGAHGAEGVGTAESKDLVQLLSDSLGKDAVTSRYSLDMEVHGEVGAGKNLST